MSFETNGVYGRNEYGAKVKQWTTKKQKAHAEDVAAINLLLGMKCWKEARITEAQRARIADEMVSEAKKQMLLLGWNPRNCDAISPYYTKTRIGIKIDPDAVYLLYQNNGLRAFIPWGIQKYLDDHHRIPFAHERPLPNLVKVQGKKEGEEEWHQAPWLPKNYESRHFVTVSKGVGAKKVGSPATVHVPIGTAYIKRTPEEMEVFEDYRKLRASSKPLNAKERVLSNWFQKERDKLLTDPSYKPEPQAEVAWNEEVRKTKRNDPKKVLNKKEFLLRELTQRYMNKLQLLREESLKNPDSIPMEEKFKKVILYKNIYKPHWFGHDAVKGLHFFQRAMGNVMHSHQHEFKRLDLIANSKKTKDRMISDDRAAINKVKFPAKMSTIQTDTDPHSRPHTRFVTNYRIPAIYIQI